MSVYKKLGYNDWEEYLHSVAMDHNVSFATVESIADMLGEEENFDELIRSIVRIKI